MNIYVDSKKTPIDKDWTVVRSYHDFILLINQSFDFIKIVSLDYYLNDAVSPEKTGLDCVKYLIDYCDKNHKFLPRIFTHSRDITSAQEIVTSVNNHLFFNERIPNCVWSYIDNF
jgi:hypothetical protein